MAAVVCAACCVDIVGPPAGSCATCASIQGDGEGGGGELCASCDTKHAKGKGRFASHASGHITRPAEALLAAYGLPVALATCALHRGERLHLQCCETSCGGALCCGLCPFPPSPHAGHAMTLVSLSAAAARRCLVESAFGPAAGLAASIADVAALTEATLSAAAAAASSARSPRRRQEEKEGWGSGSTGAGGPGQQGEERECGGAGSDDDNNDDDDPALVVEESEAEAAAAAESTPLVTGEGGGLARSGLVLCGWLLSLRALKQPLSHAPLCTPLPSPAAAREAVHGAAEDAELLPVLAHEAARALAAARAAALEALCSGFDRLHAQLQAAVAEKAAAIDAEQVGVKGAVNAGTEGPPSPLPLLPPRCSSLSDVLFHTGAPRQPPALGPGCGRRGTAGCCCAL
jgi:hypothetical protein